MAFFDKVGENLSKFGNDVSNRTKSMVEVNNLTSQLKSCEDSLKTYYSELGKKFYDNNSSCPDSAYADLFSKVKEANEAIEHLNVQIRTAKGTKICQSCGGEAPISAAFCPLCGNKVQKDEEANSSDASTIVCPKCNNECKAGSAFCDNCGEKLS